MFKGSILMRIILIIFMLTPLLSFGQAWELFKDEAGAFQVYAPKIVKTLDQEMETDIGKIVSHSIYFMETDTEEEKGKLFLVNYYDFPEGSMHSDSVEILSEFFRSTLESASAAVQGELLYADDIRIKGYPGKLWKIAYNGGLAVLKSKAYIVGRRYYSITSVSDRRKSLDNKMNEFLDSFRLIRTE